MPLLPRVVGALALAGLLLSAGSAAADDAVSSVSRTPAASESTGARAELDLTFGLMQATSRQVRERLRYARGRGTARQVACVDEALSRSDTAFRAAREAGAEALAAYARDDVEAARGWKVRVHELAEAQRLAARDGEACTPPTQRVVTGTVVRMIVDPRIARPANL